MFDKQQYELIDFGDGVKLERFADRVLSRDSPSVDFFSTATPVETWNVDASYDQRDGQVARWHGGTDEGDDRWSVQHRDSVFQLRHSASGQVGVFPEQAANWDWIHSNRAALAGKKAINLFAYTGGTTMALAAAGAAVTHVDSASSVVSWARENAGASGLAEHPIRWIVEDAVKFMQREIKRGNRYDAWVADPPSFGRGKKNQTWKLDRDLEALVQLASELCPDPTMAILSCHTPGYDSILLQEMLEAFFGEHHVSVEAMELMLSTGDGRQLPSGDCARFVRS